MTVEDLRTLFDYGYWANRKLFAVLSGLTPEEFTREVAGQYGSIRNTLVHVLSAEWGWLGRCGGRERGPALKAPDYPTLESVATRWQEVDGYVREFLAGLKDEDLGRTVEFSLGGPRQAIPLGALLQHAACHGIHHRGQVALLVRSLGHVPGNFDLIFYRARPSDSASR